MPKRGKRSAEQLTFEEWKAAWQKHYEWKQRARSGKRYNIHHKPKGKGGGQFTGGIGGGAIAVTTREADLKIKQLQDSNPEKYWTVSPTHVDDPKTYRLGQAGYVAFYNHPDGTVEVGTLAANPGQHGVARSAIDLADKNYPGQDQVLDAFDKVVPVYEKLGFKETGRLKFDPQYAPPNWRPEFGTPDIVFMRRAAAVAVGRANPYHIQFGDKGGQFTFKPGGGIPKENVLSAGWNNVWGKRVPPGPGDSASPLQEATHYWRSYGGFKAINKYLRNQEMHEAPGLSQDTKTRVIEIKSKVSTLRQAMKPSTTTTHAVRGASMDRELKPGDRFTDKGIVSLAPAKDTWGSMSFPLEGGTSERPYGYRFTVVIPEGTPGLLIDDKEAIMDDGVYRVESVNGTEAVIVREDSRKSVPRSLNRSMKQNNTERFIWTDDDVVFLDSKRANPYHVLHGDKGGQFTNKPGGGLKLDLPKPLSLDLKSKPIGVGSSLDGLPADHPTRKAVDRIAKSHGFKDAQQAIDECAAEMEKMVTPARLPTGRGWYRRENVLAHQRAKQYGVSASTTAAVESATSPRCKYVTNQKVTIAILERAKKFDKPEDIVADIHGLIMNGFKLEGAKIAKGASPDMLSGAKRRSFYNNIMFPGATSDVTIDTRMASVLRTVSVKHSAKAAKPILPAPGGKAKDPAMKPLLKFVNSASSKDMYDVGAGYYILADAVRKVAANHGESPDTIQSVVWIAVGGESR